MSTDVTIPEVGESITTATIGRWLVKKGDRVEKDQTLVELETDKVNVELPSPAAGTIVELLKKKGESGNVGDVIARIDESASDDSSETKDTPENDAADQKDDEGSGDQKKDGDDKNDKEEKKRKADEKPKASDDAKDDDPTDDSRSQTVKGDDEPAKAPTPSAATADGREEDLVPLSPIRRRIAERLLAAQHNAALLTTFNEINMSRVMQLRTVHRDAFSEKYGVKLGFMSFFVKAAIDALRQYPALNAEIRGDQIAYRNYFDIGIAVSTDRGLVVPVIRDAQNLSFADIEQAINGFADKARANKLTLDDLRGGTFTITNGGVFGSLLSTPIVNPPQSGVLGMHAIQKRPVVVEDRIVIRPMMYVALTYDHRIVDGRQAVEFLVRIKDTLEDPARMVLEV